MVRRSRLASFLAFSGIFLTLWQWMKRRSVPVKFGGYVGQWINLPKVYRSLQQMTRMVRRRVGA